MSQFVENLLIQFQFFCFTTFPATTNNDFFKVFCTVELAIHEPRAYTSNLGPGFLLCCCHAKCGLRCNIDCSIVGFLIL